MLIGVAPKIGLDLAYDIPERYGNTGQDYNGRDISRESFIRALESIKEHYVGIGASINFGPQNHQGMDDVYLTQVKNRQLQLLFYK